jgi:hypothetical protein
MIARRSFPASFSIAVLLAAPLVAATPGTAHATHAPDATTKVVFNNPTDTNPQSPTRRTAISDELIALIGKAEAPSTIKIAAYAINHEGIKNALLDAYRRNVGVQIVKDPNTDQGEYGVRWAQLKTALKSDTTKKSWAITCQDSGTGGGCLVEKANNKMHNKFALFEINGKKVVFQSSANLNYSSGDGAWNNAITIVNNDNLYGQYSTYFNLLKSKNYANNAWKAFNPEAFPGGSAVQFFPQEGRPHSPIEDPIEDILRKVDCTRVNSDGTRATRIRVAMAVFTRTNLWRRLATMDPLTGKGCDIEVVYEPNSKYQLPTNMGGVKTIAWPGPLATMHSKYMAIDGYFLVKKVVDGQVVTTSERGYQAWTGSHNYTLSALWYNDEALVGVRYPPYVEKYFQNFDTLKMASGSGGSGRLALADGELEVSDLERSELDTLNADTTTSPPVAGNWSQPNASYVYGDFTGDGKADVMAFYDYGGAQTKAWLFRSDGGALSPSVSWESCVGCWTRTAATYVAGDFTGDGKADVMAYYDYGAGNTKAWLFRSDGALLYTSVSWESCAGCWTKAAATYVSGDFTGDGLADVMALYENGGSHTTAFLFTSNGSRLYPTISWESSVGSWTKDSGAYVAGDFTGDGKADVMAFYDNGSAQTRAWLFRSDGSRLYPSVSWNSCGGCWNQTAATYVAGDFTGDGKADVTAFYDYGAGQAKAWLFRSEGAQFSPSVTVTWESCAGCWEKTKATYGAGDFSGDGKADVMAFYDYDGARTKAWLFTSAGAALGSGSVAWDSN